MSNGIVKAHHGIMAMTAKQDYETVKIEYEKLGYFTPLPRGKHWHKIENATAIMVKSLPDEVAFAISLNRGIDYYKSL